MLCDAKISKLKSTDKGTLSRSNKYSDQQDLQFLIRSSGTRISLRWSIAKNYFGYIPTDELSRGKDSEC